MRKIIITFLLMLFLFPVFSQQMKISGTITDANDGVALPGVSVIVKGTRTGTVSNIDGQYTVNAPEDGTLVFSFIGYKTQNVPINGRNEIDVALEVATEEINEIVVVGYGTQKKSLVTGSIAKVDAEEITAQSNLRVEQSLQGRTAGVTITSTSGQPGEALTVRVRGISTTGNSDPLYVVDGFPVGGIDYLNPGDIESIEVLKDAAAASIYGARGANGVVLITTKQGEEGNFEIAYDGYYGVQNAWKKLPLLNASEYAMIMNEASANAGQPVIFEQTDTLGAGTDWQDEIFYPNAPIFNHQISFKGGNDHSRFSSAFSYFSQDGIIGKDKSNYERYTYRINSDHEFGNLTFGNNAAFAHIRKSGIEPNMEWGQPLASALNIDPVTPVTYQDGDWGVSPYIAQEIVNPVAQLSTINQKYRVNKLVGNLFAQYEFIEGLKFKSSLGIDLAYGGNDNFTPVYELNPSVENQHSKASKDLTYWFTWQWENVLTYEKTINDHNVGLMAGTTMLEHRGEDLGGSKQDLIFDEFGNAYINTGTNEESEQAWGGAWHSALLSYFGRVNYAFKDKYTFTGVFRADGSSKFGENNRFAFFPSFSAGWIVSRESFLADNPTLNFLKLRLSWGQNGNQEIGDYQYTSVIESNAYYTLGSDQTMTVGSRPQRIPNPDLKWETSEQIDIGLDFGFFNNRLTATIDYYVKKTKGLLVEAPIPGYVGNNAPIVNGGDVENKGIELELGFKNTKGGIHYNINVSGAYNKNEVTAIDNAEGIIHGAGVATTMNDVCRAEVGYPIGYFWGYETDGVFQNQTDINGYAKGDELIQPFAEPGDLKFIDQNDDGVIDEKDRTMIGNPTPDFSGGVSLGLNWKGFDFYAFIYTALGHDIYNGIRRYDLPMSNWSAGVLERWTGEGTSNEHPRVTLADANQNYSRPSDFYVESGSYVRLKTLTLGYTVPKILMQKIGVSKVRLYVTGQNLLTFTDYTGFDPEIGARGALDIGIDRGIYPQARTILGGINIVF